MNQMMCDAKAKIESAELLWNEIRSDPDHTREELDLVTEDLFDYLHNWDILEDNHLDFLSELGYEVDYD